MKDRLGDQKGESEFEPIKIHLKKMNSNMPQNQLQIWAHMMEM
jgi:predicted P-loop ATPase